MLNEIYIFFYELFCSSSYASALMESVAEEFCILLTIGSVIVMLAMAFGLIWFIFKYIGGFGSRLR